jgi:hypothetical protein
MDSDTDWREFEKLVARIERALAPKGAVVKSPDRIRDLVTGSSREVDASIRYKIGTVPILITVECRKRKDVQDDTWIEQLATKKQKIGAAKTIAVSSSGFSMPAVNSAKCYGIDLRVINQIPLEEVENWLRITSVQHRIHRAVLETFNARLYGKKEGEVTMDSHVIQQLNSDGVDAKVFIRNSDDYALCVNDFYRAFLAQKPQILKDTPLNGSKVRKNIYIKFPQGVVHIATTDGPHDINMLELGFDFFVEMHETPIEQWDTFSYSDLDDDVIKCSEIATSLLGQELRIVLYNESSSNNVILEISKKE